MDNNDKLIEENQDKIDSESSNQTSDNDSEDILKKDYIEDEAPKYKIDIFGINYQFDRSTVLTFIPGIFIYTIAFVALGLHKTDCKGLKIAFLCSIGFWIFQIHNRRNEKVQHITGESASKQRARDSTIVILSIISLYTVFTKKKDPLLGVSILSVIFGAFWFTHEDLPLHYRLARNVYVTSLTIALNCFGLYIIKDFFC